MEQFEYVMTLISILVGLALTHILVAMGDVIHRVRGHGPPIKVDLVYLLWVGFWLFWLIILWWAEFKLQEIGFAWTFGAYLLIITYFITQFLAVVILVPLRMDHVSDTYAHFMEGRIWFFGATFVALVMDFFDTLMKGADWALRPEYLLSQTGLVALVCVIGVLSKNRTVQLVIAAAAFVSQAYYTFMELNVLGAF